MEKKINNSKKIALITGTSRGLGYQLSKTLSKKNYHIIAVAKTIGGLEELSDEITSVGGNVTLVPLDLSKETNIKNLYFSLFEKWKKLDILIHSAATPSPFTLTHTININDLEKCFKNNTYITLNLIKYFDPLLKKTKSSKFIYIDDKANGKFKACYSATKSASREIVNSYYLENIKLGPKVFIVEPLPMPTSLRRKFYPGEDTSKLSTCELEAEKIIKKLFSN